MTAQAGISPLDNFLDDFDTLHIPPNFSSIVFSLVASHIVCDVPNFCWLVLPEDMPKKFVQFPTRSLTNGEFCDWQGNHTL
jgi:hypothetical protein